MAEVEKLEIAEGRTLEYILAVPAGRYGDFATLIDGLTFAEAKESVREGGESVLAAVLRRDLLPTSGANPPHVDDAVAQAHR